MQDSPSKASLFSNHILINHSSSQQTDLHTVLQSDHLEVHMIPAEYIVDGEDLSDKYMNGVPLKKTSTQYRKQ